VVPYTLTGNALNAGFQPFGSTFTGDTIDGLAFLGEATPAVKPLYMGNMVLGFAGSGFMAYRRKSKLTLMTA
jgi:hypothetical protein